MPLVFETLKTSKNGFYRFEHQKRKDEICPFSSLADFNPLQLTKSLISIKIDMEIIKPLLV